MNINSLFTHMYVEYNDTERYTFYKPRIAISRRKFFGHISKYYEEMSKMSSQLLTMISTRTLSKVV